MSSRIGGTIATFLLSVPVSAAGLMFGLPYLNQVINSPEAENVIRDPEALSMFRDMVRGQNSGSDAPEFSGTNLGQSASPWEEFPSDRLSQSQPEFGQNSAPQTELNQNQRWNQQVVHQEHINEADGNHNGMGPTSMTMTQPSQQLPRQGFSQQSPFTDSRMSQIPGTPAISNSPIVTAASMTQESSLSWQQATRQLTELGIQDYHLERGHEEGAFLFVCLFSPGDSQNVKHRFESEASDPLIAVNQVLNQINNWLGERYTTNRSLSSGRTL